MEIMRVELGFLKTVPKWKLRSKYFRSKVGGKPAWLNLKDLPSTDDLLCEVCKNPMVFLLQVYAPVDHVDRCFHRAIFVFLCRNPHCFQTNSARNFKVFRSQLARKNSFYDYELPAEKREDDVEGPSAPDLPKKCNVCGCRGPKKCSKCSTSYCSVYHQKIDWKLGHKAICKGSGESSENDKHPKYTLPEYKISTEFEYCDEPAEDSRSLKRTNEERMREYEKYDKKPSDIAEQHLEMLEGMAKAWHGKTEKHFPKYMKRVKLDPEQILRYQIGGNPLWASDENIPSVDGIPPCPCGAKRQFEFQIMSMLLNYLKLDWGVDWGTLVIYTCSENCEFENKGYHKEFILKQDFSSKCIRGAFG